MIPAAAFSAASMITWIRSPAELTDSRNGGGPPDGVWPSLPWGVGWSFMDELAIGARILSR